MTTCFPGISRRFTAVLTMGIIVAQWTGSALAADDRDLQEAETYLVQASNMAVAKELVGRVGGITTKDLEIINAVGARLTAAQLAALRLKDGLRIYDNADVVVDGSRNKSASNNGKKDGGDTLDDPDISGTSFDSLYDWLTSDDGYSSGTLEYSADTGVSDTQVSEGSVEGSLQEASDTIALSADYTRTSEANGSARMVRVWRCRWS